MNKAPSYAITIAEQSVELRLLKRDLQICQKRLRDIHTELVCCGRGPFNDNVLHYNTDQLSHLRAILALSEE